MSGDDLTAALDELDRRKEAMPKVCPSWCLGDHMQALEEGADIESAAAHSSEDFGGFLHDVVNPLNPKLSRPGGAGWQLQLVAGAPGPSDLALVRLELRSREEDHYSYRSLFLTSGEARTIAAQLIALADMQDVGGWRRS